MIEHRETRKDRIRKESDDMLTSFATIVKSTRTPRSPVTPRRDYTKDVDKLTESSVSNSNSDEESSSISLSPRQRRNLSQKPIADIIVSSKYSKK